MRLVRFVQAAIGLAATGGVAFMLSGSALAADSSLGPTSQQHQAVVAQPAPDQTTVSPVSGAGGSKDPVSQQNSGGTVDPSKASNTTTPAQTAIDQGQQQDPAPLVMDNQQANAKAPEKAPTASETVTVKTAATTDHASDSPHGGMGQMMPLASEGSVVVTISTPVISGPAVQTRQDEAVVSHTTVLAIQPMITSRLATDLAALIPSAPAPVKDQAPVPAQSTGLLGNLTAQLAGTALPQLFTSHALAVSHLLTALNLAALIILLMNVFTFTYGLWLRRGGFATAARSDSPALVATSVATPFWTGYASLPLRLHSPFSDGGRNETLKTTALVRNVFRKEERS
jgi:hypothetical protein